MDETDLKYVDLTDNPKFVKSMYILLFYTCIVMLIWLVLSLVWEKYGLLWMQISMWTCLMKRDDWWMYKEVYPLWWFFYLLGYGMFWGMVCWLLEINTDCFSKVKKMLCGKK